MIQQWKWFLSATLAVLVAWLTVELAFSQAPPAVPKTAPPKAGETAAAEEIPLAALADPAFAGITDPIGFTPVKGSALPVRDAAEAQFSDTTKKVPLEVYRDEDFQTLVYVSQNGNVAAVPYRKNFEVRTHSNDTAFAVIRFSPTTGISWQLVELKWQPVIETTELPLGDYDVRFMPTKDGFTVLRIDRFSGQVWFMDAEDKWQLAPEGDGRTASGALATPGTPGTTVKPPMVTPPKPPMVTPPRPPVPGKNP